MKKIALTVLLITALAVPAFGQSLSLGVTGGLSTMQSPDTYTKDIPDGFGFGSTANYGLKAKLGLPVLPLTITGQVNYSKFSSDESGIEYKQSLLIFGAGVEYNIIPVPGPVNPYIALDVFYSNFGDFEASASGYEVTSDGASRMGLGLGAGVEFTLLPQITLEASAKYNFNNLMGKEDDEDGINTTNISIGILYDLY